VVVEDSGHTGGAGTRNEILAAIERFA